jgi:hypothetical protein
MPMIDEHESPRGIPQMRTDWLTDVARRLAAVGLDELRTFQGEHASLVEIVDHETWRFDAIRLSESWGTVVELDADLYLPTDTERATMRAGFELAPRWTAEHGHSIQVRTEIGPRGAVTFDPENWIVVVPADQSLAAIQPPVGVEPSGWALEPAAAGHALREFPITGDDAAEPDFARLRFEVSGLAPVIAGEALPEVLIAAFDPPAKRGFLAKLRGRGQETPPNGVLTLRADGPLEAAWTGEHAIDEVLNDGLTLGAAGPILAGEQLTLRGPQGVLTIQGPNLVVSARVA